MSENFVLINTENVVGITILVNGENGNNKTFQKEIDLVNKLTVVEGKNVISPSNLPFKLKVLRPKDSLYKPLSSLSSVNSGLNLSTTSTMSLRSNRSSLRAASCSSQSSLNSLNNNSQNRRIQKKVQNSEMKCNFCGKSYFIESQLKRHVTRVHQRKDNQTDPLICPHCDFTCKTMTNLRTHVMSKHHRNLTVDCEIENCTFELPVKRNKVKKPLVINIGSQNSGKSYKKRTQKECTKCTRSYYCKCLPIVRDIGVTTPKSIPDLIQYYKNLMIVFTKLIDLDCQNLIILLAKSCNKTKDYR